MVLLELEALGLTFFSAHLLENNVGQSLKSTGLKLNTCHQRNVLTRLCLKLLYLGSGLALTSSLACLAFWIHQLPGLKPLSPLILAMLLGLFISYTIKVPDICQSGVQLSLKGILKLAVILLGLQLNIAQLVSIGPGSLAIVVITLITTFSLTCWLGKQLGIHQKLAQLIAVGTSICGASAILATSAVTKSSDEDSAYAITIVTLFGSLSMVAYPLLWSLTPLSFQAFGIWCGASIHEVAQVIAAAFQVDSISVEVASIVKLSRILFLAPIILLLGFQGKSYRSEEKIKFSQFPFPWFVLFFLCMSMLNSLGFIPEAFKILIVQVNQFLFTAALAAMGLKTQLKQLKKVGLKPLYLGFISWLFISTLSYGLVLLLPPPQL